MRFDTATDMIRGAHFPMLLVNIAYMCLLLSLDQSFNQIAFVFFCRFCESDGEWIVVKDYAQFKKQLTSPPAIWAA